MINFMIFVTIFLVIASNALNSEDFDTNSKTTTELSLTDEETVDSSSGAVNHCSHKCSEEIQSLKKNITELYAAFVTLQSQLEHLNQHLSFHEKALKHIAVWGHKGGGHHSHHQNHRNLQETDQDTNGHNESAPNQQNDGSNRDLTGQSAHNHNKVHHNHHHNNHQQHIHRPHHNNKNNYPCNNCGGQQPPPHKLDETEDKKKDEKSSEESSEEQSGESNSKPKTTTVLPNSEIKDNENIPLNDSQTNPSEKSPKRVHFSNQSVKEQLYFQSMQSEFKEWFTNMLNDIHHNPGRVDRSDNGVNIERRLDQSAIDQMENALNSEDLIFATCSVKPNRHIALLNQQEVEGTINLWQLRHNRGPLHMHIKLKGFKISNHEDSHLKHNGQQSVRRVRESILMPVEVEPEDPNPKPMGWSHSHGFHVHEFGNLSRGCQSVGSHYNPLNLVHGGPYDVVRHVGDLGNIRCDKNGVIDSEFTYTQISLSGIHSIINRSLVIHGNVDDYGNNPNSPTSAQTGSTGVRIACCVIEEVKQLPKEEDSQSNVGSVARPIGSSKRRRDTSEPIYVNKNRYEEYDLNEILKKMSKYQNDRKYRTSEFN